MYDIVRQTLSDLRSYDATIEGQEAQMKKTNKWGEFLFDTRLGAAVLYVMAAVSISVFFGGLLSVFMRQSFLSCAESVF